MAAHVVRADFAFEHIFGRGHLDGWFPQFMVGHQEFLFYGPGYTWVLGLVRLLSFGTVSTVGAVKIVGIAGLAAIAPAVMFLARSFCVRAPAAVGAGLLALAVNSPFGVGIRSTYVIGLLPNQIAAVLFCIAIGAAARAARQTGWRWVMVTAAAFSFLAVTHVITAGIAAAFLGLVVMAQVLGRDTSPAWWTRLAAAGALAVGLAAFWTVPFLAHRDLRGPVTGWSTPPFLDRAGQVVSGEILFPAGLSLLAGLGLVATVWFAPRRHAVLAVIPPVYLSVAHALLAAVPGHAILIQLPNRGLGYAGLFALVPIGITLDLGLEWLRHHVKFLARSKRFVTIGLVGAAGLATLAFAAPGRHVVGERGDPDGTFATVAAELRRRVPDGSRFVTERDYPSEVRLAGFTHPDLWLAQISGRATLNNFNPESSASPAGFVSEQLRRPSPADLAESLTRYGVSHVVTVRPKTTQDLTAEESFQLVWKRGNYAIVALRSSNRVGPLHAGGLDGSLNVVEPEYIAATVRVPTRARVTAALSWSPKWEVRVDGKAVATRPAADRVVTFVVPGGTSDVELRFRRDRWDLIGGAVTVATGLLVAYLSLSLSLSESKSSLMSRRRSRTA